MTRRGWLLLATLGVIWGMPYLLIKVDVDNLSPLMIAFLRVGFAAAVLIPIALARREFGALRGHWRWVLAFATMELLFPYIALNWAEQEISSSLAALLIAATPLVSAFAAWRVGIDDRLTAVRIVGLVIGLVGVAALIGQSVGGGRVLPIAAVGVVVLGFALAPIVVARKLQGVPSIAVLAASMGFCAVVYAPFAWLTRPTVSVPVDAWGAIIALGVVCTALPFVLYFALIAEAGPSRSTLVTYINPAVALLLGVVVLREALTIGLIVGFPLVLLGSYLATRRTPFAAGAHR